MWRHLFVAGETHMNKLLLPFLLGIASVGIASNSNEDNEQKTEDESTSVSDSGFDDGFNRGLTDIAIDESELLYS
jgi:hypothetical protein